MDIRITDRGTAMSFQIGDVVVTYLSGKDVDAQTPVFDMSVGEITLENTGDRPINLKFNAPQTFFVGHSFEFGSSRKKTYSHHHIEKSEPTDFIDYDIPPGGRVPISRRDYMDLYLRLGRAYFLDGTMCTQFEGVIQLDNVAHTLQFGPHCFKVDLDRDWDQEQARYLQFFADRDKG
jgi:hypothetical protein